ncbi:MAG TPA: TraB/GumN family protein [Puia sp.]|nr:TraB/GumN family protein [Puia sp.]
MMHKRLFAWTLPLFFVAHLCGQTLPADAHSLLWKISGKGLPQESYIFINTSNTCETRITLDGKIATVLSKVKSIAFEAAATNRAKEKAFLAASLAISGDYTAGQMLSPFVYFNLKEKAREIGLSEGFLNQHNIFFVKLKLETACISCDLSRVVRWEDVVRDTARKLGLPVTELLGMEEFFDMYHHYPKAFWDKSITYLLDHPENVTDAINKKAAAYRAGDLAALRSAVARDEYYGIRYKFPDQEAARCALLTSRIEKQINQGPVLIVLDVSEISSDPTSVFTALTTDGYALTQVLQ